jgi:hypothetical protein
VFLLEERKNKVENGDVVHSLYESKMRQYYWALRLFKKIMKALPRWPAVP